MKDKIEKLISEYKSEVKKLREKKEHTTSRESYYYLGGEIIKLKQVISDLRNILPDEVRGQRKKVVKCDCKRSGKCKHERIMMGQTDLCSYYKPSILEGKV